MEADLKFEEIGTSKSGKTKIYEVTNFSDDFLGEVKWYSNWRRYVFFPDAECKFDAGCLRRIANFCSKNTKEQQNLAKRTRRK